MEAERDKYQSSGRLTGENTHGHEAMLPFITSIWTPFTRHRCQRVFIPCTPTISPQAPLSSTLAVSDGAGYGWREFWAMVNIFMDENAVVANILPFSLDSAQRF